MLLFISGLFIGIENVYEYKKNDNRTKLKKNMKCESNNSVIWVGESGPEKTRCTIYCVLVLALKSKIIITNVNAFIEVEVIGERKSYVFLLYRKVFHIVNSFECTNKI